MLSDLGAEKNSWPQKGGSYRIMEQVTQCEASQFLPFTRRCWDYAGFKVITAVVIKNCIFWDTAPCSPTEAYHAAWQ
jgi:hypothetical protein